MARAVPGRRRFRVASLGAAAALSGPWGLWGLACSKGEGRPLSRTDGRPLMSPLRLPAKTMAPCSFIVALVRFAHQYS
jgi:hypothetical protein